MAKVNYISEQEGFALWASANRLTPRERLLWHALFHVFNGHASGDVWPEGYIEIRMHELEEQTGLGRDTIESARADLVKRGLIGYRSGDANRTPASYRLHYISVYGAPERVKDEEARSLSSVESDSLPIKSACPLAEKIGKPEKSATLPKKSASNTESIESMGYKRSPNEDDEDNIITQDGARAKIDYTQSRIGEARDAYRDALGREPTPVEVQALGEELGGMDVSLLREALMRAAVHSAVNPVQYAIKLLRGWMEAGVRDAEELEVTERYQELMRGPNPDIAERARSKLAAWKKERDEQRRRGGWFSLIKSKLGG